jgi:uncharacterized repeat protein (TIGR03943 family)
MVVALNAVAGTIGLLVGAVLLRLTFTGAYTRYVRPGMGPLLVVAGLVVVVLGAVTIGRALRREPTGDGHDHDGMPRAGWLLLAPVAALLLVAPPALGSFGVGRGATIDVTAGAPAFEPLPDGAVVPMTLLEYSQRAAEHAGESFNDATVELTGFVVGSDADGFQLARYQIACCAADAAPIVVQVVGVYGDLPPRDAWVTVTGRFDVGGEEFPRLVATGVTPIVAPDDPYE